MSNIIQENAKTIVGLSIRTNNNEAADTIPALWGQFFGEGVGSTIASKASDDVYAVYTDFENEGVDNTGQYTFLIGVEVSSTDELIEGLTAANIPCGNFHRFDVPENKPEQVFPTWMQIWPNQDIGKTFLCDFEKYSANGDISINVGTHQK